MQILGRNQAVKLMLGKSEDGKYNEIKLQLENLRNRVAAGDFTDDQLQHMQKLSHEVLYQLNRKVMGNARETDSRLPGLRGRG